MLVQLAMITKDLPSPCKNTSVVKLNWQLKLLQLISEVAKNKVNLIQLTTIINLQH